MNDSSPFVAATLSALRLVSFVPHGRDAVHVGLLSLNAEQVVDLETLGISDALEAIDQLPMLRQAAGAIMRGATRHAFPVHAVHLVAPIPLVRCVVQASLLLPPVFADPVTLHGPGGHLSRGDAAKACVGLAAVVGDVVKAGQDRDDRTFDGALVGTVLVLGWPQPGPDGHDVLLPGAVGPFVAVPRRRPESLRLTHVAPLSAVPVDDVEVSLSAPCDDEFLALARVAARSHTLRPGDLLTIFPQSAEPNEPLAVDAGSWLRASAPGLGTLSLAVR